VDGALYEVARAGSLHAAGAGSDATGLTERIRAHVRARQAIGRGHSRSSETSAASHAEGDPRTAGSARYSAHLGVTIAAELGNISSRFESARKLSGSFPDEKSSGKRIRKGGITKAGNAHLRRIVVESALRYRHLPRVGEKLRKRQQGIPAEISEIAWKAQNRLHKRYRKLTMAGKDQSKVMVAVGRELLGFIWATGVKAEQACQKPIAA
jgi:transposase